MNKLIDFFNFLLTAKGDYSDNLMDAGGAFLVPWTREQPTQQAAQAESCGEG